MPRRDTYSGLRAYSLAPLSSVFISQRKAVALPGGLSWATASTALNLPFSPLPRLPTASPWPHPVPSTHLRGPEALSGGRGHSTDRCLLSWFRKPGPGRLPTVQGTTVGRHSAVLSYQSKACGSAMVSPTSTAWGSLLPGGPGVQRRSMSSQVEGPLGTRGNEWHR